MSRIGSSQASRTRERCCLDYCPDNTSFTDQYRIFSRFQRHHLPPAFLSDDHLCCFHRLCSLPTFKSPGAVTEGSMESRPFRAGDQCHRRDLFEFRLLLVLLAARNPSEPDYVQLGNIALSDGTDCQFGDLFHPGSTSLRGTRHLGE